MKYLDSTIVLLKKQYISQHSPKPKQLTGTLAFLLVNLTITSLDPLRRSRTYNQLSHLTIWLLHSTKTLSTKLRLLTLLSRLSTMQERLFTAKCSMGKTITWLGNQPLLHSTRCTIKTSGLSTMLPTPSITFTMTSLKLTRFT